MATGTAYRYAVWFARGMREYTRGGYEKAARNFGPGDLDVDISGCSYMITGANSGIGKCTAMALAKKGATVHMVCRSQERGEQAKQDIVSESGNDKIQLHILDLSQPRKVIEFANSFVESEQGVDVLVNNAGVMVNQRELTEEGLEKNFSTNTLGTYLLTTRLTPALEKSSDPRVVTVSSGGMLVTTLDPNDLNFERLRNFDGTTVYAQNKRQQVVMTRKWAEKYPNIHFSSMHPGWADTPAVQTSMPRFRSWMENRLRTPDQGADTVVWLCVAKQARDQPSGSFFQDRQVTSEHLPWAKSRSPEADETLLMTRLEELAERFSRAATPLPTATGSTQQDTPDPSSTTTAEETPKE